MDSSNAVLTGWYDYRLVAVCFLVAISASYTALNLGGRVTAASGWIRSAWLVGGAIAVGIGIWSMHFAGMLAFHWTVPVSYHWPTVLLSLLAAIIASADALYVATRRKMDRVQVLIGSLIMGGGIASMHYLSMAAMRLRAICHYRPLLVGMSVVIAVIASSMALVFIFDIRDDFGGITRVKVLSATLMGSAIFLVHYAGMASVSFFSSTVPANLAHTVSISSLGTAGLAIVTLMVQGVAISISAMDRNLTTQVQELQTSAHFRQIADNLREVLALSNADISELLYVNRAYEEIWGRAPESLYANPLSWLEAVHVEDREQVQEAVQKLIEGEPFDYLECRIVRPDGSIVWVALRGYPVRDAAGRPHRIVGTARDITKRKRAENALRESEDRYRDLVEHSHDLICTHDREGNLLSVNEAPLRILGYTRDELLNKPLRDFVTPGAKPLCDAYLAQIQRDGFAKGLLPVLTKSGELRLWEFNNSLRRDGVSRPIVRGLAHDVTEQKRAEAALRKSEEKFSKAFHSSPIEMVITTLEEGRFLDVNESFERNIGYGREEVLGRTSLELGLWADPAERAAMVEEIKKNGQVLNREIQIRAKSGEIGSKLYSAEVIEISHEQCLLAVSEDITERKRAEEGLRLLSGQLLQLQDEERRRIARDLHDAVGQDLVALATYLGQLNDSIPSSGRKLRKLVPECQALADRCIREVRTLSYLLHPPMLDEAGLEDAIRHYVEGFTKRSGIQVELEMSSRLQRMGPNVEMALFRVVQESLTNVERHSRSLQAAVRINLDSSVLTLEISDRGRGAAGCVPGHTGESVFEFGVGIPSMLERVKLIGGHLDIEPGPGGTTVRVTIPLASERHEKAAHPGC